MEGSWGLRGRGGVACGDAFMHIQFLNWELPSSITGQQSPEVRVMARWLAGKGRTAPSHLHEKCSLALLSSLPQRYVTKSRAQQTSCWLQGNNVTRAQDLQLLQLLLREALNRQLSAPSVPPSLSWLGRKRGPSAVGLCLWSPSDPKH